MSWSSILGGPKFRFILDIYCAQNISNKLAIYMAVNLRINNNHYLITCGGWCRLRSLLDEGKFFTLVKNNCNAPSCDHPRAVVSRVQWGN